MVDLRVLRTDPEKVRRMLQQRGYDPILLDQFLQLDERWRWLDHQINALQHERNTISQQIARSIGSEQSESLRRTMAPIKEQLAQLETERRRVQEERLERWSEIPNFLGSEIDQTSHLLFESEKLPTFAFEPRTYLQLLEARNEYHSEAAAELAGAGFVILSGEAARLERALIGFMLETHRQHGYQEFTVPLLVKQTTVFNSGQYPRLKDEMFRSEERYLIPTAEVPLLSIFQNKVFRKDQLPLRLMAQSVCFRREIGRHEQIRGLARMHQFQKVELVRLCDPDESEQNHQELLEDSLRIVRLLGLTYRVRLLDQRDHGSSAAKTFDIEVYAPGSKFWFEVSSCSNCTDYQTRRARIRQQHGSEVRLLHSLNSSGLALPRVLICVLETYQTAEGNFVFPPCLQGLLEQKLIQAHL